MLPIWVNSFSLLVDSTSVGILSSCLSNNRSSTESASSEKIEKFTPSLSSVAPKG